MLVSVLKFFIIVLSLLFFVYATNLAFRGDLEMVQILHDYYLLKQTFQVLLVQIFTG